MSTDKTIAFGPAALYCDAVGDCRPGEGLGDNLGTAAE